MKNRKLKFFSSLIVFVAAGYFLISGSPLVTMSLSKTANIPLGNLTTWIGMIALPLTFYYGIKGLREPGNKTERILSFVLKALILLAILWVPISYLLAGNMSNSFSNTPEFRGGQLAMRIFWINTYVTVAAPLLLGIIYGCYSLVRRISK